MHWHGWRTTCGNHWVSTTRFGWRRIAREWMSTARSDVRRHTRPSMRRQCVSDGERFFHAHVPRSAASANSGCCGTALNILDTR